MYGTLRGALAGRKIAFDRETFTATVDGRISGIGKTIRIKSIHVHYDLRVPREPREPTERALDRQASFWQGVVCCVRPSRQQQALGVTAPLEVLRGRGKGPGLQLSAGPRGRDLCRQRRQE